MKKSFVLPLSVIIIGLIIFLPSKLILAQKMYVIESKNLKTNDTVLVFTPDRWSSEKSHNTPALFLLHGWSGNWRNWGEKVDLQKLSNKWGFIIITPDGFYNSWYLDNIE